MQRLKYIGYFIVLQEVPDEITLAFNISGCPYHCDGCHSSYLWDYAGRFVSYDLQDVLKKYSGLITCVCFMGGDQNRKDLDEMLSCIKKMNLKTAIYTGNDTPDLNWDLLDYVKYGHYDKKLGGLSSRNTNQKMLRKSADGEWEDITYKFWKEGKTL